MSSDDIVGVFVFRRDMRLVDNHGLLMLMGRAKTIIPVFLMDKDQICKNKRNQHFFSNNAVQFMCESLVDLDNQLQERGGSRLRLFFGRSEASLDALLKDLRASHANVFVGWNVDFSDYAVRRDKALEAVCVKHGATLVTCDTDFTLRPMEENLSAAGAGFKQYGAFYKRASRQAPTKPLSAPPAAMAFWPATQRRFKAEFDGVLSRFYKPNAQLAQRGGRELALARLDTAHMRSAFAEYNAKRDMLAYNTTNVSAALNFGCISIREAYYAMHDAMGPDSTLLKQLYWRDFYLQVVRYIPRATSYTQFMDVRYDGVAWKTDVESKNDWSVLIDARTGFLLIDAAMNEMKTTGFMHNRCRMLVAVFWTKYLLISILHPIYGSQVGFSKWLVDAVGPSQNKMNHHWTCDLDYPGKKYSAHGAPLSGRPMDVSNKMIAKWDRDCVYIKRWLPHLAQVPNKDLRKWDAATARVHGDVHPAPMFDAKERYKEWIAAGVTSDT